MTPRATKSEHCICIFRPKGKSADSQPIPRVLIHFGKSANYRTRVSSSSPGTLQVPLTGCTNRAISRTVCAGQKQLRKL